MFLSVVRRARLLAWQAKGKGWMMREATCRSRSAASQTQLTMFGEETENRRALFSGKTYRWSCLITGTRSGAFLESLPEAAVNCNRQGKDGQTLVVCLDPAAQSLGARSTPNFSEWPNDAAVCSLWQVLETGVVPMKYFLSAKACAGILRRAENRGEELPAMLESALQQVVYAHAQDKAEAYKMPSKDI